MMSLCRCVLRVDEAHFTGVEKRTAGYSVKACIFSTLYCSMFVIFPCCPELHRLKSSVVYK
jgi:hypothetical protein